MADKLKYRRLVLKLSGQSLCPPGASGIESQAIAAVVREIVPVVQAGAQPAVVVGGGNFVRGRELTGEGSIQRATADSMGMLATVMNALALRDALEAAGLPARVMSAIPMPSVCEGFDRRRAIHHLEKGRAVLLAGGTGSPFLTTDTAAALRACEIGAEVIVKATKVEGVFDSDPMTNPAAKRYDRLTYQKVLADRLGVMDLTAISLCEDNGIPIIVCQVFQPGNLLKAVRGEEVGTLVAG